MLDELTDASLLILLKWMYAAVVHMTITAADMVAKMITISDD